MVVVAVAVVFFFFGFCFLYQQCTGFCCASAPVLYRNHDSESGLLSQWLHIFNKYIRGGMRVWRIRM